MKIVQILPLRLYSSNFYCLTGKSAVSVPRQHFQYEKRSKRSTHPPNSRKEKLTVTVEAGNLLTSLQPSLKATVEKRRKAKKLSSQEVSGNEKGGCAAKERNSKILSFDLKKEPSLNFADTNSSCFADSTDDIFFFSYISHELLCVPTLSLVFSPSTVLYSNPCYLNAGVGNKHVVGDREVYILCVC